GRTRRTVGILVRRVEPETRPHRRDVRPIRESQQRTQSPTAAVSKVVPIPPEMLEAEANARVRVDQACERDIAGRLERACDARDEPSAVDGLPELDPCRPVDRPFGRDPDAAE